MTLAIRPLEFKVALVTGSTSGIGLGIARRFADLGAKVVLTGLDYVAGEKIGEELRAAGAEAQFFEADLAVANQCAQLVQFTVDHFGGVDALVNNAARTRRGGVETTTLDEWDLMMKVNLRAPFALIQACLPHMRRAGGGSIVNIGSINAYCGRPNMTAYSVSKGALMTLTRNAALALAPDRVRVNQINVGWTLTEGEDRIMREEEAMGDDWAKQAAATRPLGRLLAPEDVARAAAFFASAESEAITGAVLDLDQLPPFAPSDREWGKP